MFNCKTNVIDENGFLKYELTLIIENFVLYWKGKTKKNYDEYTLFWLYKPPIE